MIWDMFAHEYTVYIAVDKQFKIQVANDDRTIYSIIFQ